MVQTGGSYKYLFLVTAKKKAQEEIYMLNRMVKCSPTLSTKGMCENILPNIGSVQQIQKPERRNFE